MNNLWRLVSCSGSLTSVEAGGATAPCSSVLFVNVLIRAPQLKRDPLGCTTHVHASSCAIVLASFCASLRSAHAASVRARFRPAVTILGRRLCGTLLEHRSTG